MLDMNEFEVRRTRSVQSNNITYVVKVCEHTSHFPSYLIQICYDNFQICYDLLIRKLIFTS